MPATDGGLGEHIVGDKFVVGKRNITVNSLLDEGKATVVIVMQPMVSRSYLKSILKSERWFLVCLFGGLHG